MEQYEPDDRLSPARLAAMRRSPRGGPPVNRTVNSLPDTLYPSTFTLCGSDLPGAEGAGSA
ncbi:hypothetical protein ACVNF4_05245 [Streptomyces sp. S6]